MNPCPPTYREGLAVLQTPQQVPRPCPAQGAGKVIHVLGDTRDDHDLLDLKAGLQPVFQIEDMLHRVVDGDLDHALLAGLLQQAVHLGRRQSEAPPDLGLGQPVNIV